MGTDSSPWKQFLLSFNVSTNIIEKCKSENKAIIIQQKVVSEHYKSKETT